MRPLIATFLLVSIGCAPLTSSGRAAMTSAGPSPAACDATVPVSAPAPCWEIEARAAGSVLRFVVQVYAR